MNNTPYNNQQQFFALSRRFTKLVGDTCSGLGLGNPDISYGEFIGGKRDERRVKVAERLAELLVKTYPVGWGEVTHLSLESFEKFLTHE